jgi:hypothetical protein
MIKIIPLESGDIVVCNWNTLGHMAGWIETLFSISKNLPKCGAVSALVLDKNKKIFVHGSRIVPGIMCPASYAMGEDYFGQYEGTREVECTHFICAIIKKDLLKKLKLPKDIGENIFIDASYCIEARKRGFKIYASSDLVVQYGGEGEAGVSVEDYSKNFEASYNNFKEKYQADFNKRMGTPVMYHSSFAQPTGFATALRGYIKGLTANGVKVAYNFLKDTNEAEGDSEDDFVNSICEYHGDLKMPQIVWAQAPYFVKNSGKYKIGHCEFEGDWTPEIWVENCNMMDEIWVPTKWDREKFRHAGVNVPIYVFAQGIDKNYFHPDMAPMQFQVKESFKFVCNSAWDPRKNLANMILAFKNEFREKEDVCLVLKTINTGLVADIEKEIKKIKYPKDSAQVYIREEPLPQEQMGCFYTAGDAFILSTRGEGWGLPAFEALACGLPVITTGWGALNETLRDNKGEPFPGVHFIRSQKVPTDTPYIYLQGNYWAEPSIPHLQELMRYVYEHKDEEKKKALQSSEVIRKVFDWEEVTKPIKERLTKIYQEKM